jgi:hypothetical protein
MKSTITTFLFAAVFTIVGCKEPKEDIITTPGGPTLTTTEAQNITATSALLGGNVTSEGACALITGGVVVATSRNPTTGDLTFPNISSSGTGSFTVSATGLLPATRYYARAYAVNCKGINYGNEVTFTTLSGGGVGIDTGYFTLTIDGVTYSADDMLGPNTGRVYPEGDTRFASVTLDGSTGEFAIIAQSSAMYDDSKNFGFGFNLINKPLSGQGNYTFSGVADANKATNIQIRTSARSVNPLTNCKFYDPLNATRSLSGSNCVLTTITSAPNTLNITTWGNQGEFVVGTVNGTVYENARTEANCSNSVAHPYTVSFKLKRVQ